MGSKEKTFICPECKEEKETKDRVDKQARCNVCFTHYLKTWNRGLANKIKRFKTSMEEFMALLSSSAGKCDICHIPLSQNNIAIDHNHKTNKVRGLLCRNCNTGLGLLKDNPHILESARVYLEERTYFGVVKKPRNKRAFGKKRTDQFKQYLEQCYLTDPKTPFLEKIKEQ